MSQPTASVTSQLGACPCCARSGIKLTSSGLLYNHGPRASHCPGTGRLPVAFGLQPPSLSQPNAASFGRLQERHGRQHLSQNVVVSGSIQMSSTTSARTIDVVSGGGSVFSSQNPAGSTAIGSVDFDWEPVFQKLKQVLAQNSVPIVRWIPKSARRTCATALSTVLNAVVANPAAILPWMDLLLFSKFILAVPTNKLGRPKAVSESILSRCQELRSVGTLSRLESLLKEALSPNTIHARSTKHQFAPDEQLAKRVMRKLEEGNFRAAVNAVRNEDTIASFSTNSLDTLKRKHPLPPSDRRVFKVPDDNQSTIEFDNRAVAQAVLSFPSGSAGGPDGLSPQHLKDLLKVDGISGQLAHALTSFVNIVVRGAVSELIRPLFFGARLHAFVKKDGGLRPIAVGLTLRRVAAKVTAAQASSSLQSLFFPLQLGVGVSRGLEAGVHSTRVFLDHLTPDEAVIKIDFSNAFNTLRRDAMLEAAYRSIPAAYSFVHASYAHESILFFGNEVLFSSEGLQQGDPLGPLLFSITTLPLLSSCAAPFKFGYLDDFTLGGNVAVLDQDVAKLKNDAKQLGLIVNDNKCEVICSPGNRTALPTQLCQFSYTVPTEASLLGVPLSTEVALQAAILKNITSLELVASRLSSLHSQDALLILRHSFSTPCIQHLLRGIFCSEDPLLEEYDRTMKAALASVLNTQLDDPAWRQASLPIKAGGLGIRSAVQLSASAFLSSVHGANSLVSRIMVGSSLIQEPMVSHALGFWNRLVAGDNASSAPSGPASLQKSWDAPVVASSFEILLNAAPDQYSKARLRAVSSPHAGDWLKAIPSSSLGLRLDNEGMRIAIGLRLGTNLCAPFTCACGNQVDARGAHGLSCARSAGRQLRHTLVNDEVLRAFSRAGIPARREPSGLIPGSQLRPDGASVTPWSRGRCVAWDVTCPDTLAASHLGGSANSAGSAAEHAAALKTQKYNELASTHCFVPIAMETLGSINADGLCLLNTLGGRCIATTGDTRERTFLFQRLSMAVQRGNVACFTGSVRQASFFYEQHSEQDHADNAFQSDEEQGHHGLVGQRGQDNLDLRVSTNICI
jgi:Reverse transcriptase (RNA-dependent DNA polymerase)